MDEIKQSEKKGPPEHEMIVPVGCVTCTAKPNQSAPLSFINWRKPPPLPLAPNENVVEVIGNPMPGSPISKIGSIGSAFTNTVMANERTVIAASRLNLFIFYAGPHLSVFERR